MNPNTAEPTVVESVGELALPPPAATLPHAASPARARAGARLLDRVRADDERARALRDTWRALWSSRLLVLGAGVATVLLFGFGPHRTAFDPPGLSRGLGALGDVLAAPVARWDSNWYLLIAHYGYHPALGAYTVSRSAFFPLYPLGLGLISGLGVPPVAAGVLLSLCALAAALYGLHRLTTLELGAPRAGRAERAATRPWRCTRWPSRRWPSSSRRCTRSRCTWRSRSASSGAPGKDAGRTWACWGPSRAPPAAPAWCCSCRR